MEEKNKKNECEQKQKSMANKQKSNWARLYIWIVHGIYWCSFFQLLWYISYNVFVECIYIRQQWSQEKLGI